jgi:hypothetical protein
MNIYWITRLTSIVEFFGVLSACSTIFLISYLIAYLLEKERFSFEEENKTLKNYLLKSKKYIKFASFLIFFSFLLSLFIPDQDTIKLMILKDMVQNNGVKIIHTVENPKTNNLEITGK